MVQLFQELRGRMYWVYRLHIPSLKTQASIIAEIEAEQTLVAANRDLIERFEKKIHETIERVWEGNTSNASCP